MPDRVFAVAGAKGGVGKTTTSINLAAALKERGTSTITVELDLAMANMVDFLDIGIDSDTDPTLHDVLAGNATVTEAIYSGPGGMQVMPSGVSVDGFMGAATDTLGDVVSWLRTIYDVVILDTGAGLSRETLLPLAIADAVILVSSPRVASVRDTKKTMNLTERVGGQVSGVVFVRSGTGLAPDMEKIAAFLDTELLGHIPEDPTVPASQDAGKPVTVYAPNGHAAVSYREIAERIDPISATTTTTQPPESATGSITERLQRSVPGLGEKADDDSES